MTDATYSPSLVDVGGRAAPAAPTVAVAAPTAANDRLPTLDILRGVGLLGILVLNIEDMGIPEQTHDVPLDAFTGPHAHVNAVIWALKWLFFEGKMRGLFSMLFGAGVVLLAERFERRGASGQFSDIYFRRNMWLLALGLVHGIFLWSGDILFFYGWCALMFLYPFRLMQARTLLIVGTLLSLTLATVLATYFVKVPQNLALGRQVATLEARQRAGETLSADDLKREQDWKALVSPHVPDAKAYQKEVSEVVNQSYADSVAANIDDLYFGPAAGRHYMLIFDEISAMLIGMGLFKNGFLTGRKSKKVYALTAVVGFLISLPLYALGALKVYHAGFAPLTIKLWMFVPYYLTREAGSIAIAAVVLLLFKQGLFKQLFTWFGAVGRTALSNYLLTSLICQIVFVWGPWALYGKLEYYQIMYVALAIWVLNMVASTLWLHAFRFGPVEWVWRSLTYARLQPMRK